jgi:hypothetical protein
MVFPCRSAVTRSVLPIVFSRNYPFIECKGKGFEHRSFYTDRIGHFLPGLRQFSYPPCFKGGKTLLVTGCSIRFDTAGIALSFSSLCNEEENKV